MKRSGWQGAESPANMNDPSSPGQAFRWLQPWLSSWLQSHEKSRARSTHIRSPWIPNSQKLREIINVSCFKLLDFGIICYANRYLGLSRLDETGKQSIPKKQLFKTKSTLYIHLPLIHGLKLKIVVTIRLSFHSFFIFLSYSLYFFPSFLPPPQVLFFFLKFQR